MRKISIGFLVLLCSFFTTLPAFSAVEMYSSSGLLDKASIDGAAYMVYRYDRNVTFTKGQDYNWAESALAVHLNLELKHDIDIRFGGIFAGTFGTDSYSGALGLAAANNSEFTADEAYIRIKNVFDSPVTVTLGKQMIEVEKQFLVSDGSVDWSRGVWNNSERAFPMAARVDVDLDAVNLTAFYAKVDTTSDPVAEAVVSNDVDFAGLNVHYTLSDNSYIYGGTVMAFNADDTAVLADSWGGDTYALYLGGDTVIGDLHLEAEIVKEFGDAINNEDRDALAGFAYATYTLTDVAWTPYAKAGGWYVSGDDPDTDDNEAFMPFTPGFTDFGRWCPGEISGELYLIGSTNFYTMNAEVGVSPAEWLQLRLQYFGNYLSEDGGGDDKFSDEVNLIAHIFPRQDVMLNLVAGVAEPGEAAEAAFGGDETAYTALAHLMVFF